MNRPGSLAAVAAVLLTSTVVCAQSTTEQQPFARARLDPGRVVAVGQPVTVTVEVLVPTWFTGAPRFPAVELADALTVFEDRGSNFTERIDGRTWAGQSRRYRIFPQVAGRYEIAAIPVQLRYSDGGAQARIEISPRRLSFEARMPQEARDLPYFIGTTDLTVEDEFDRDPAMLMTGEAFRRTIRVTVRDAMSMVIPPVPLDSIRGLATYPDPPVVTETGGERGSPIVGVREQSVSYVAERAGDYRLPAVELVWWDTAARRVRQAGLPAVPIRVEPNPRRPDGIGLPADDDTAATGDRRKVSANRIAHLLANRGLLLTGIALGLALAAWRWRRYGGAARRYLEETRRRRRVSEPAHFARLKKAARSGDPGATWRTLTAWLDSIHTGPGAATVQAFAHDSGDAILVGEIRTLEALLFTRRTDTESGWSGINLSRALEKVRRRRRRSKPDRPLPDDLNPGKPTR